MSESLNLKLKISTKKLSSGKCQVKFFATVHEDKNVYGYVLVEPKATLKEVISSIRSKITASEIHRHKSLYSIGKNQFRSEIMLFNA